MKKINHFLIAFIFGFFLLTLFIEPVIYETEDRSPFSNQIPNINLNIPINENVEYDNFEAILEEKLSHNGRTEFTPAWTVKVKTCLLYTSPSPRDRQKSRMPSSA